MGTILFVALLAWLIYLCCRKKAPEGFTQFNNDNGGKPHRRHWRWRNKHFWRRNRRQNHRQNNPDLRQTTNVIVQPVVVAIPYDENPGAPDREGGPPNMPPAPPGYDESMKNPPMPSQFMNPPMPSNFNNPPMQGNFHNPPMNANYNNPPMQGNFSNPPMQGNYNNPPMQGNFNNPPMQGNFNNPPMPGNFNNPPMQNNANNVPPKNPNASSYYTKY